MQVSAKGSLSGTWGEGTLQWEGTPGAWIVHYTYDGLGRLIRKQSPWPTLDPYGRPQVRTEHFYYDGVRRVQEVVTDPIALDSETDPIGIDDEAELPPLATVSLTRREYIHSPGYVDEVVAQVDVSAAAGSSHGPDRPAWVIQDANYNLVGLVGDDGTFLHQYTWDPYGEPVAIERYDTGTGGAPQPFENRIGHQGLFFDRFDGQANNVLLPQLWVDPATGLAAKGVYQNRGRMYRPELGRFLQRDPRATGSVLAHEPVHWGQSFVTAAGKPDIGVTYADGMSLYAYLGSSPAIATDPMGLFGYIDGLMTGLDMADTAGDMLEQGAMGVQLQAILANMIVGHRFDSNERIDWASDWDADDDMLVPRSRGRGAVGDASGWIMAGIEQGLKGIKKGKALAVGDRKAFRAQARRQWKNLNPNDKLKASDEIHHRKPLEWAHITGENPSAAKNLQKVHASNHYDISRRWTEFRRMHPKKPPTKEQIEAFARSIDRDFNAVITKSKR